MRVRVLLFAMTGFGNNALKVLAEMPVVELLGILTTPRQEKPFPYYECESLHKASAKRGIPLYEGLSLKDRKTEELIKDLSPDLIVVSTFNQIIPRLIISIPRFGIINVHPSLLPKYRGATPISWAIINGEEETGITVHFIEDEKTDCGRIITQSRLKIEPSDTDGTLRQKLARLSEDAIKNALSLVLIKDKTEFPEQDEKEASYYPKRTLKDAEISPGMSCSEISKRIRAASPYPGAFITYMGRRYKITDFSSVGCDADVAKGEIVVNTLNGMLKFKIKEDA